MCAVIHNVNRQYCIDEYSEYYSILHFQDIEPAYSIHNAYFHFQCCIQTKLNLQ